MPVRASLLSVLTLSGLTVTVGLLLLPSDGLLNCGPRWMWILLSSVVMMLALELYFLTGVGTVCFSGVTFNIARPMVISWGSGEADASTTGVVLTVMIETGDMGLSE